ncbi:heat shock 70 kDa protein 16-like [Iris pallida]|uniref:Heat shock 70 kDa protein 16-like n=1 Tax=Iris pallida TaxID=29817 RepID=A0AAX6EQ68_IRIPA|nr:heat shock 70 kDa protein 16-like [Iris pallida]KAJ6806216.1 heat shock 70 kDa protein 16-like [Iris pallida]
MVSFLRGTRALHLNMKKETCKKPKNGFMKMRMMKLKWCTRANWKT